MPVAVPTSMQKSIVRHDKALGKIGSVDVIEVHAVPFHNPVTNRPSIVSLIKMHDVGDAHHTSVGCPFLGRGSWWVSFPSTSVATNGLSAGWPMYPNTMHQLLVGHDNPAISGAVGSSGSALVDSAFFHEDPFQFSTNVPFIGWGPPYWPYKG